MFKDEIGVIIDALGKLGDGASFAQKFGPYYFALLLLAVGPFICRAALYGSLNAKDASSRTRAYEDFRFYLRSVVKLGAFCVVAGVGWFLFDNYRQGSQTVQVLAELKARVEKLDGTLKNMNYVVAGVISSGLKPKDELYMTMANGDVSIVFAKLPQSTSQWYFVVMSNSELPKTLDTYVAWSQTGDDGQQPSSVLTIPIKFSFGKKFGTYRFSFEDSMGRLQPVN
jgi:hypothetical protein